MHPQLRHAREEGRFGTALEDGHLERPADVELFAQFVDASHQRRDLSQVLRASAREPPVPETHGTSKRGIRVAPEEDRGMRRRDWLRLEVQGREVEVVPVVLGFTLCPENPHRLDALLQAREARSRVDAQRGELFAEPAGADTHDGPSARENVERGDRTGRDDRVSQCQDVDRGAELDRRRDRARPVSARSRDRTVACRAGTGTRRQESLDTASRTRRGTSRGRARTPIRIPTLLRAQRSRASGRAGH